MKEEVLTYDGKVLTYNGKVLKYLWSHYWETQDEVLFISEISKIIDGKLYNQKSGATDYLTVTGVTGSYTFQCPNTAPYIAADTDYIWFKTDESQRTPTEAELVGYDLQRTPVKYDNTTPNAIRWVAILKAGVTITGDKLNNLFSSFDLSVWWNGILNLNGFIKDNRIGQQLWTPEFIFSPEFLSNCVLYLSPEKATVTGNGVSLIEDKSSAANDATQETDAARPPLILNALNGNAVIEPVSGDSLNLDSAIAALTNYTICFVAYAKADKTTFLLTIPESANNYIAMIGLTLFRMKLGGFNGNFNISITEGYHIFTVYREYSGAFTSSLRVDTIQVATFDNASGAGNYTGLYETSVPQDINPSADIVVYSDYKSLVDIQQVENFFKNKYGL